jgi:hypothetical protein
MADVPSTPPSTPPTAAPRLPPIDPTAILNTAIAVLKNPAEFYRSVKDERGFQKVVVFSVAMYLVHGVCSMVWPLVHGFVAAAITGLVVALISGFIAPFLGGLIVWAICLAFGTKEKWERAVPIAGYATAVVLGAAVGALIPFVGWIIGLVAWVYGLYVLWVGAKTLMFEPTPEAPKPLA